MTHVEEAFEWLEWAGDRLQAAKDNRTMGHFGLSVSAAYYAAFHAAKSVIAYARERDPRTHAGVSARFGQLAVVESDFPPHIAGHLAVLAEQRGRADYDLGIRGSWESYNVSRLLEITEAFVAEVRVWLERQLQTQ